MKPNESKAIDLIRAMLTERAKIESQIRAIEHNVSERNKAEVFDTVRAKLADERTRTAFPWRRVRGALVLLRCAVAYLFWPEWVENISLRQPRACRQYQRNLPEDASCYVCGGSEADHARGAS